MSVPAGTPGSEVPEADWAEQAVEVGPPTDAEPSGSPVVDTAGREAEPADVAEQGPSVDFDDEE